MPKKSGMPAYRRRRRGNGPDVAVVVLTDAVTGRRMQYTLGSHGSTESRRAYARLLVEWEARGRRLEAETAGGVTVAGLCLFCLEDARSRVARGEFDSMKAAARVLVGLYGDARADAFGPRALRAIRTAMVGGDPNADPPRKPWTRGSINRQINRVRAFFRWGVGREMVAPATLEALRAVEPLRAGAEGVAESKRVHPVQDEWIDSIRPFLGPRVRAMVDLQRLTGMRPGEVTIMRTRDVDVSGDVWLYRPSRHKTMRHGHAREIWLGPRAVTILKPWLRAKLDDYLFQPREEVEDFRRARKPNDRAANDDSGRRRAGSVYRVSAYAAAIRRACDRAGAPRWHLNQLRHSRATEIRAAFGVEAARTVLGHKHLKTTELYAERDDSLARRVAEKSG